MTGDNAFKAIHDPAHTFDLLNGNVQVTAETPNIQGQFMESLFARDIFQAGFGSGEPFVEVGRLFALIQQELQQYAENRQDHYLNDPQNEVYVVQVHALPPPQLDDFVHACFRLDSHFAQLLLGAAASVGAIHHEKRAGDCGQCPFEHVNDERGFVLGD